MDFYISNTNKIESITITDPKDNTDITSPFFAYCGILALLPKKNDDGCYPISAILYEELSLIAMVERNILRKVNESHNTDDFTTLSSHLGVIFEVFSTKEGLPLSLQDKIYDVGLAIKDKYAVIERLVDGEVIVQSPVNKKFWPLGNTSHTFSLIKTAIADDEGDGTECWQVEATMGFVLNMPDTNKNKPYTTKVSVIVGRDKGSLYSYAKILDHTILLSKRQEDITDLIVMDAIYSEISMMTTA